MKKYFSKKRVMATSLSFMLIPSMLGFSFEGGDAKIEQGKNSIVYNHRYMRYDAPVQNIDSVKKLKSDVDLRFTVEKFILSDYSHLISRGDYSSVDPSSRVFQRFLVLRNRYNNKQNKEMDYKDLSQGNEESRFEFTDMEYLTKSVVQLDVSVKFDYTSNYSKGGKLTDVDHYTLIMRRGGKKWMVWSATNSNPSTSPIDNRNNIDILEYCGLPVDMDSQKLKSIQDKKIANLEKINNNLIHEMNREYVSNTYDLKSKDVPVKMEELEYEVVRGKNNKGELTLYIRYKNNSKYKITNLSLGIDDYTDGIYKRLISNETSVSPGEKSDNYNLDNTKDISAKSGVIGDNGFVKFRPGKNDIKVKEIRYNAIVSGNVYYISHVLGTDVYTVSYYKK